jgi:ferredoxin-NADP reductase
MKIQVAGEKDLTDKLNKQYNTLIESTSKNPGTTGISDGKYEWKDHSVTLKVSMVRSPIQPNDQMAICGPAKLCKDTAKITIKPSNSASENAIANIFKSRLVTQGGLFMESNSSQPLFDEVSINDAFIIKA